MHGDTVGVKLGFEFFVDDALVRGVHIDDHQPMLVLRQDVDAVELRQREAKRRNLAAWLSEGFLRCLAAGEQHVVEGGHLRGPESQAMMPGCAD